MLYNTHVYRTGFKKQVIIGFNVYSSGRCLYSELEDLKVMRSRKAIMTPPTSNNIIKAGLPTNSLAALVVSMYFRGFIDKIINR